MSPPGGVGIAFERARKAYPDGTVALDGLTLEVRPGEVCAIVGPSGSGKSTALRLVNRLVEPSAGRVLVGGRDVATADPTRLRRGIGYVIQHVGLFPHRTVGENVGTVPRLLGWPDRRVRSRVEELLDLVGLDPAEVRDRYPHELSGGQQQRIGVARALAAEPPVLLMDEPFGAVDPVIREHLQDELLRIHGRLGTTILIVTHDVNEAIKLADRVAILGRGGRLVQHAPPAELLSAPADDFVRRFVGADRALKHLSLLRVADCPLDEAPVAAVGEAASCVRRRVGTAPFVLHLDGGRPEGWVSAAGLATERRLSVGDADPSSPLLRRETTLYDALALLLASAVQTGVVVGDGGGYLGTLSLSTIADAPRRPRRGAAIHPGTGGRPGAVAAGGG